MKDKLLIAAILLCFFIGVHQGFLSNDYWWFLDNQIRECIIYAAFTIVARGKMKMLLLVITSLSVIELSDELLNLNIRNAETINGVTNDRLIVFGAFIFICYILSKKQGI